MKKSMFFAILIALFATTQSVSANDNVILLIERSNGTYGVSTNASFAWGENKFQNAIAYRSEYGTYLVVQSQRNSNESRLFFREAGGKVWKFIGTVCDMAIKVRIAPKDNDWYLSITSDMCEHLYQKRLSVDGDVYEKIK